jgi:hypothetical protein
MFCRVRKPGLNADMEWVRTAAGIAVIHRAVNEGMDFAAHNTSITYAMSQGMFYTYYILLNSSVKGPLLPKYYVGHWSKPYTDRINGKVKAVGSSIVCLPSVDAGASAYD